MQHNPAIWNHVAKQDKLTSKQPEFLEIVTTDLLQTLVYRPWNILPHWHFKYPTLRLVLNVLVKNIFAVLNVQKPIL